MKILNSMKKLSIVIASILMFAALKLNAQNERILLFECFTSASCGPCAQQNPALDVLIDNNADRIAAIKYHMNWPLDNDPMYHDNPSDNNSRRSFYNVNSVPQTVVDGNRFSNMPSYLNQNSINNWLAIESPMEMRLDCEVDQSANIVTVHVMGRASSAITGSLKLYVGIIEKEMHYPTQAGSNGEKDFYSVMKKLLPQSSGIAIADMNEGDYFTYTFTWEMANVYDVNEISAIAWVQNTTNKEVIQACNASETMVTFFENDAIVHDISNLKSMNCSGQFNPVVKMTNVGQQHLTSAQLEVLVNDEIQKTVDWTGDLDVLEATAVEIGEFSAPVNATNTFEVRMVSANGTPITEGNLNARISTSFKGSPENVGVQVKLQLHTDGNPEETTWKLTNLTTGEVVQEGGPYADANHTYTEFFEINADGCYDFTIYDASGNGFVGNGLYGVKAGGTTLFSGTSFLDSESNEFSYGSYSDAEETMETTTCVFPNPTSGIINIQCVGEQTVVVYNLVGQRVYQGVARGQLKIDLGALGSGVYSVKVGDQVWRTVVQ